MRNSSQALTAELGLGQLADSPAGELIYLDRIERPRVSASVVDASPVRVVIADGQALVRGAFRALLEVGKRINVVGEAASGEEAVRLAGRLDPDVVLVDVCLPGLDCVEATRQILARSNAEVMLLTGSENDERIFAALRSGVSGLLLKDTEPAELARAVEVLARGEALLSPAFARRLIAEFASRPEPHMPDSELLDELTAREREVVTLVGHGLSNDEIAEQLVVSPATAKTHVSRAMVKLDAHDRAKLVVLAYESGLVLPHSDAPAPDATPLSLAT
jgi:DNA-binding NarL/FixJ family response regulator